MFEGKKGSCKVVFDDGSVYDGEIENGKRHGTGKFTDMNWNVYEGDWKEDKWDGKGKLVGSDEVVYEGEFKDGKFDGKGRQTWPNEYTRSGDEVYEGQWKENEKHGTGTFTWFNGDMYEGDWKKDKRHGTGTMAYADGSTYAGEWAEDEKHGSGTFTDANGEKYKRVYNNGERVSNKRVATLINGPPSQRPCTAGGITSMVVLSDEHTECGVCFTAYSTEIRTTCDNDVRRHLPVLSTCGHVYCHGCVLDRQVALAEGNSGVVPEKIPCMKCRRADAFSPSQPTYDTRLIEQLEQCIPVIEEHSN